MNLVIINLVFYLFKPLMEILFLIYKKKLFLFLLFVLETKTKIRAKHKF